ncbi:hypothetical protein FACS189496_2160 [Bacilli bacterium]|nr:hypothetical protein FACS189496_2160 [Bacilli bacterium]
MPRKNNYWERLYHWTEQSDNKQLILADRVDADTNDICINGLSKALTQTEQGGLPVDSMNFDKHKIINLKKATEVSDAASLSNLRMANYYEGHNDSASVMSITMPPNYIAEDLLSMDGMRFFIRSDYTYTESIIGLSITFPSIPLPDNIMNCPIFSAATGDRNIEIGAIKSGAINEFIFCVLWQEDNRVSPILFLKDFPDKANQANVDLGNVASIDGKLSNYIVATNVFFDDTNFIVYTGIRRSDDSLVISCHRSNKPDIDFAVATVDFGFTAALGANFKFEAGSQYTITHASGHRWIERIWPTIENITPESLTYRYSSRLSPEARSDEINIILKGVGQP